MTELEALLLSIRQNPHDDTVRLAFADFLEEHDAATEAPCECSAYIDLPDNPWRGEPGYRPERDPASGRHEGGWSNCKTCNSGGKRHSPGRVAKSNGYAERAEFIRLQCRIASLLAQVEQWSTTPSNQPGGSCEDGGEAGAALAEAQNLRAREQALLSAHHDDWLPPGVPFEGRTFEHPGTGRQYPVHLHHIHGIRPEFRRGFLSRVAGTWEEISQNLDAILADPWVPGLDEVELTTWPEEISQHAERDRLGLLKHWYPAVRSWKLPPEPRVPLATMSADGNTMSLSWG